MWFKQEISLDDLNFDMENYSSLVDVKLLLSPKFNLRHLRKM